MPHISASVLNSPQVKLHDVKLIIIDEVSMVGCKLFWQLHRHLTQIFNCNLPSGGKSVILLGDFYQLPPLKEKFIFEKDTADDNEQVCGNMEFIQYIRVDRNYETKRWL